MDLEAQLHRRRALSCEECGHRIAWTTYASIAREGPAAWRWQGARPPIRYRMQDGRDVVDLECFACGWTRTRPVAEVELGALTLWWREILAFRTRWAEQTEQRRAEAS